MDRRAMLYGVKRYLGEIRGPFCKFRVLESGVSGYVVLCPLIPSEGVDVPGSGIQTDLMFVYPRKRFRRGVLPPIRPTRRKK